MFKFFKVPLSSDDNASSGNEPNRLQRYIQSQSVQDMAQMASEISPDVKSIIGMNVQALLGYLPASEFNTTIMSSKESLQNLLASAMLTGYFMHAMEYRMLMDDIFEEKPKGSSSNTEGTILTSPEELFGEEVSSPPSPTPSKNGKFMSGQELLEDLDDSELSIQLEINTNVDLSALLEELKTLPPQGTFEEEHEEDPHS